MIDSEKCYSMRFEDKKNENRNMVVFGSAGSGKTFLFHQEIDYILKNSNNDEVIVFASYPEEYKDYLEYDCFKLIKFNFGLLTDIPYSNSNNEKELLDVFISMLDEIKLSKNENEKWLYIDCEYLSGGNGIAYLEILLKFFIASDLKNTSMAIALHYLNNDNDTLPMDSSVKKALENFTYFIFGRGYITIPLCDYCPVTFDSTLLLDQEIERFLYSLNSFEYLIYATKGWKLMDANTNECHDIAIYLKDTFIKDIEQIKAKDKRNERVIKYGKLLLFIFACFAFFIGNGKKINGYLTLCLIPIALLIYCMGFDILKCKKVRKKIYNYMLGKVIIENEEMKFKIQYQRKEIYNKTDKRYIYLIKWSEEYDDCTKSLDTDDNEKYIIYTTNEYMDIDDDAFYYGILDTYMLVDEKEQQAPLRNFLDTYGIKIPALDIDLKLKGWDEFDKEVIMDEVIQRVKKFYQV